MWPTKMCMVKRKNLTKISKFMFLYRVYIYMIHSLLTIHKICAIYIERYVLTTVNTNI